LKCKFHPQALSEFQRASDHYHEISEPLEAQFIKEFQEIEKSLANHPLYGHPTETSRRRLNFKKFPYHLIYEVFPDHLGIFVLRHNHQDSLDEHKRIW